MRLILFICLVAFVGESLCGKRHRHDVKTSTSEDSDLDRAASASTPMDISDTPQTKAPPRKQRLRAIIERIQGASINGSGCENMKCKLNKICVGGTASGVRANCYNKKLVTRLSRVFSKLQKVSDDVRNKSADASQQLQQRLKKIKEQVEKFQLRREKKQQQRLDDIMSAAKPLISVASQMSEMMNDDAAPQTMHGDTSCRSKDLAAMGQKLLDKFKKQQEEETKNGKHRKEKRNSIKKQLHDVDECTCQATVVWEFQQLNSDSDGHVSSKELVVFEDSDLDRSCVAAFFNACDHNGDSALNEKEWCCCFADVLPPCLTALSSVPSILIRGVPAIIPGSYVPQCDDDGFYKPAQCDSMSGQCWCVDHNGRRINGTLTSSGSPDC